jgi:hypothetical protein
MSTRDDNDGVPEDGADGYIRLFDARKDKAPAWSYHQEAYPELGGAFVAVMVDADSNIVGEFASNDEEETWAWAFARGDEFDLPIVCATPGLMWERAEAEVEIPEFEENPRTTKTIIVRALTRKKRGKGFRVMSDKKVSGATWPKAQAEAWKIARTIQPKKSKWWFFGKKSKMNTVYYMTYIPT